MAPFSFNEGADNNLKQRKPNPMQTFLFGWGLWGKTEANITQPDAFERRYSFGFIT